MPNRVFVPRHNPPSLWDRIRVHSTDVGLAVLGVSAAVQVLLTPLFRAYAPSISLRAIDPELALVLAVFLGVGGALAVVGVLWSGPRISTGWVLEQTGWILSGFAWIGYAALVAYSFPFSTISYSISGGFGLICLARAYVVLCIERSVRPGAEVAKQLREIGEGS